MHSQGTFYSPLFDYQEPQCQVGLRLGWWWSEREENPAAENVFVGTDMLNKSGCRSIKPPRPHKDRSQWPPNIVGAAAWCWQSPNIKLVARNSSSSSSLTANSLRQVGDNNRELLLVIAGWGIRRVQQWANTFWYSHIFFVCFLSFLKNSQESWGKGREISFLQHEVVRCFRLAHHVLGNEVVLKNWPTLSQPNSNMDGLTLGWYKPIWAV